MGALADFCLNTEALFKITCRFHCECSAQDMDGQPVRTLPHANSEDENCPVIYRIPHCRFSCEDLPRKLEANREAHLYRITQEAVNNAITHGRAKRIEVNLAFQNGEGTLAIQDDGVGIDRALEGHRGIGLHTMAYRARVIRASFEVNRRVPRGTVVTCVFPVPPATPNP